MNINLFPTCPICTGEGTLKNDSELIGGESDEVICYNCYGEGEIDLEEISRATIRKARRLRALKYITRLIIVLAIGLPALAGYLFLDQESDQYFGNFLSLGTFGGLLMFFLGIIAWDILSTLNTKYSPSKERLRESRVVLKSLKRSRKPKKKRHEFITEFEESVTIEALLSQDSNKASH